MQPVKRGQDRQREREEEEEDELKSSHHYYYYIKANRHTNTTKRVMHGSYLPQQHN